jgi:hypothetical protein
MVTAHPMIVRAVADHGLDGGSSGVYGNPLEIFDLDRTGAMRHRKAFLQQRGDVLLAQPLAPAVNDERSKGA